jgi:hypothetical protein
MQWQPNIHCVSGRQTVESSLRHAGHRKRHAVQSNNFADCVGLASKRTLPVTVAENERRFYTVSIILWTKNATHDRPNSKSREELAINETRTNLAGWAGDSRVYGRRPCKTANARKQFFLFLKKLEYRIGEGAPSF